MKCRFSGSLGPELPARKPGSFAQRFQLRPHHRRMHAAIERPLRKAAIGAGDHVLAADNTRQARNALGHQLRMLDDIGGMTDDTGNQHLARTELCIFPYLPFVFMTRVGALDDVGAHLHLQDQVDDLLERHVAGMWSRPGAPAHMIADAVSRQPLDRVVENVDLPCQPFAVIGEARRRHHAVIGDGTARVVELEQETGIDDHLVFGAHRFRDRSLQLLVASVVLVLAVGNHARRRSDRQKTFFHLHVLERGLEVVDVALQFGLPGIFDRADADRLCCRRDRLLRIELGVELGKLRAISATLEWISRLLPERAALEARQALECVLRPADGLAELAVADDVNAGTCLLAYDVGNRVAQAFLIGFYVVRLAALPGAQEVLQRLRTDQAADMRRENAIGAAFHARSMPSARPNGNAGLRPNSGTDLRPYGAYELLELGRILAQNLAGAVIDDTAAIHHHRTWGDVKRKPRVLLDQHNRQAARLRQPLHRARQLLDNDGCQSFRRLVHQ